MDAGGTEPIEVKASFQCQCNKRFIVWNHIFCHSNWYHLLGFLTITWKGSNLFADTISSFSSLSASSINEDWLSASASGTRPCLLRSRIVIPLSRNYCHSRETTSLGAQLLQYSYNEKEVIFLESAILLHSCRLNKEIFLLFFTRRDKIRSTLVAWRGQVVAVA